MIVQCEHCQTKYRIPNEKVKGKGVKVRCAKCNNTFTVLPASDVPKPVSPPHGAGQPAAPDTLPPEKPARSPFPGLEQPAPEAASSEPGPPVFPKQDRRPPDTIPPVADSLPPFSSDGIRGSAAEPGLPPLSQDLSPEGDQAEPSPDSHEPPPQEETPGHRPAHERDRNTPEPLFTEQSMPSDFTGFEIENTPRDDTSPAPEQKTVPPGGEPLGTPPSDDGVGGWGNISLGSERDPEAEVGEINLAEGAPLIQPPPPPIMEDIFPDTGSAIPDSTSAPEQATAPSFHTKPLPPKKSRKGLVLLLALTVLGAGGYFGYPRIMEIINAQGEKPGGTLAPDKIQVRPVTRQDGKVLYTVIGEVTNNSSASVGLVQIEAQFRNSAGDIVAKSKSYCGNVFEEEQIVTGDIGKIRTDLQNELGQSLSNSNIRPGQSVPFLVVLENPPAGISKVTVTISGFKETT